MKSTLIEVGVVVNFRNPEPPMVFPPTYPYSAAELVFSPYRDWETEICAEVVAEAKKRYGSVPTNDEIGDLLYRESCKNAPEVTEITKDDSDYGDFYWGKIDGKLTKLVFISDDESKSEAWFNGLRPTKAFVDGDRLHIEA